jgi:hypothetical protein
MSALLIFQSLAELLKAQALASYLFLAIGEPLPLLPSSLAFLAAIALARSLKQGTSRKAYVHFFAHLAAYAVFLFATRGAAIPLDQKQWINLGVTASTLGAFWLRALWLEAIPLDHEFCAERFDEGLALFLGSMTIAALVSLKGQIAHYYFLPFVAFSILAIGLAQAKEVSSGAFKLTSRHGSLLRLAAAFAIAGAGIWNLVPALARPAQTAAQAMKTLGIGALDLLARILVWLFTPRGPRRAAIQDNPVQAIGPLPQEIGQESSLFSVIVMWVLLGAATIFVLILLGYLLLGLIRAMGRTVEGKPGARKDNLLARLKALLAAIRREIAKAAHVLTHVLVRLFFQSGPQRSAAKAAYARLLHMGRFAGLPRRLAETPRQFALRLRLSYPMAAEEGGKIVELLEKEIYGEKELDATESSLARAGGRKLRKRTFLAERLRKKYSVSR